MRHGERMVTLADGREVSNYSPEWMRECTCRWLLDNKPTRTLKHLYLYGVHDRRQLMFFDPKVGRERLADNYRERWVIKSPLMKFQGLEAADRLLADARTLHEILNKPKP